MMAQLIRSGVGAPGPMMRTRMQPRHVMAALAVLATALAPDSAAATCAGARSNLAFIQQRIGVIRAEMRTAGANEAPQGARQELARWAAVLPRAEQDVVYECAAAAPAAQGHAVVAPPTSVAPPGGQATPPLVATPVITLPMASQPTHAVPTETVARPMPTTGAVPRAPAIIAVAASPVNRDASERSMRAKLEPAQGVAAGAITISTAYPRTARPAALEQPHPSLATHKQTPLPLTTGTAVRKGATAPQQSLARPIFKAKNSQ